jgi:hypothetical protein
MFLELTQRRVELLSDLVRSYNMINIKEVEINGETVEMIEIVDDLGNATSMTKEYYDSLPKTFGGSI